MFISLPYYVVRSLMLFIHPKCLAQILAHFKYLICFFLKQVNVRMTMVGDPLYILLPHSPKGVGECLIPV